MHTSNLSGGCICKKVCFGDETIDFETEVEPISIESFQQILLDEDRDGQTPKPYFAFAYVHSSKDNYSYKHLYSAENIVNWYPLEGTTDPCTGEEIEKIEYYFYVKGNQNAIHMGDVAEDQSRKNEDNDDEEEEEEEEEISLTKDLLIWTISAEDEPSKMLSLLAIAYLYNYGLCKNMKSNDKLDTSDILKLSKLLYKDQQQSTKTPDQEERRRVSNMIYKYIVKHLSNQIRMEKIKCSDLNTLLTSIKHDAAHWIAEKLVELDPNIDEDSEDYSKLPHIRMNALTMAIQENFHFDSSIDSDGSSVINK